MPPRILPGPRNNDAVMEYKAILETSLAFSRTFNSRNIEFFWYPLWNQTLSDLVADVPNLIVAPQFPVWFVPMIDDNEDENDGDDPEEIVQPPEGPDQDEDDEAVGVGAGNISFASTIPEKKAEQVVVDFVILNLMAVAQPQPELKTRYGGWRITAASVGLLVEVKRFVSRSLTGQNQTAEILLRILEACSDLIEQAAHVFIQDPTANSVLAIAAAGPYWRSAVIRRTNVYRTMHRLSAKDPNYQAPGEQRPADPQPKWNNILRVDLPRSRDRLQTIYRSLKKMGVLDV